MMLKVQIGKKKQIIQLKHNNLHKFSNSANYTCNMKPAK